MLQNKNQFSLRSLFPVADYRGRDVIGGFFEVLRVGSVKPFTRVNSVVAERQRSA